MKVYIVYIRQGGGGGASGENITDSGSKTNLNL